MPHPMHEKVRQAYGYRCGYCGIEESAAGGEFTVDHYQPRSVGGTDELENLVYCCYRCNQYKGDSWPTTRESAAGYFVLRPSEHNIANHIHENQITGELEPLTATGAFHIRLLRLNRPPLIANRLAKRAEQVMKQRIELLEEQIQQSGETIRFLMAYIGFLKRLITASQKQDD